MTEKLIHLDALSQQRPDRTTNCSGCSRYDFSGNSSVCKAACTEAARNKKLDNPSLYYFFDPLVHATNRLKGLG